MTPKEKILTFRRDDENSQAMESLKESDGVPFSEQISPRPANVARSEGHYEIGAQAGCHPQAPLTRGQP